MRVNVGVSPGSPLPRCGGTGAAGPVMSFCEASPGIPAARSRGGGAAGKPIP